jgi:hypothetical protein
MLLNPNRDNDYTFRFTPAALAKTSVFYASRVFLVPYLGFAIPAAAFFARNRRTWFGLAMMGLFFLPMLFLPGRIFSAYCYLPFTGLAIAFAGMVEVSHPVWIAVFFLLWLPMDLHELRAQRRETLAKDDEVREWVTTLERFAGTLPRVDAFIYSGAPAGFQRWGVEGALKYCFARGDLKIHSIDDPETPELRKSSHVAYLSWDGARRKLEITVRAPTGPL